MMLSLITISYSAQVNTLPEDPPTGETIPPPPPPK